MSLRGASKVRTVCEVLREVNDVMKENPSMHRRVFPLLVEAEAMCKKMSAKLRENNRFYDKGWWEENKDYEQDLIRRENESGLQ